MTTFDKCLVIAIMCMIGTFVYLSVRLESRIDDCHNKSGIMVNTPNGYRCLTKDDFK